MIRKISIYLTLSFLASCVPHYQHPVELFEFNENCPNVCWLGIQPGVSTKEEVQTVLNLSKYIDNKTIKWTDRGVVAIWSVKYTGPVNTHVGIEFDNNTVSGMAFTQLHPLSVDDFIGLLNEPEEISLFLEPGVHDDSFIWYQLYYLSLGVTIEARSPNNSKGPQPSDEVFFFGLDTTNETFSGQAQEIYKHAQPWLGYGHLEVYLNEEDYQWLLEFTQ